MLLGRIHVFHRARCPGEALTIAGKRCADLLLSTGYHVGNVDLFCMNVWHYSVENRHCSPSKPVRKNIFASKFERLILLLLFTDPSAQRPPYLHSILALSECILVKWDRFKGTKSNVLFAIAEQHFYCMRKYKPAYLKIALWFFTFK